MRQFETAFKCSLALPFWRINLGFIGRFVRSGRIQQSSDRRIRLWQM